MTMGTTAVILTEAGKTGTTVNYDGYPEHQLPTLQAIVQRDGLETASATLRRYNWSYLDADVTDEPEGTYRDDAKGKFLRVPGYGVAYIDRPMIEAYAGDGSYTYLLSEDGAVRI